MILRTPGRRPASFEAALAAFGTVDVIVNNAAWIVRSNIETTDAALFDRCMAVNVRAPLLLVQAALPHLKRAQGCVLNIGSINGYCGEANATRVQPLEGRADHVLPQPRRCVRPRPRAASTT